MARDVSFEVVKAPRAELPYGFSWSSRGWLAQLGTDITIGDGQSSTTAPVWTITAENDENPVLLTSVGEDVVDGEQTWINLSGGTADADYIVTVFVTCTDDSASKDERSFRVRCRQR